MVIHILVSENGAQDVTNSGTNILHGLILWPQRVEVLEIGVIEDGEQNLNVVLGPSFFRFMRRTAFTTILADRKMRQVLEAEQGRLPRQRWY